MRLLLILCLFFASPLMAQDQPPNLLDRLFGTDTAVSDTEQGTLLEELLEDSLSGAGRSVTVRGFEGALTSQAQLEELTIADADGVWFTLRGATLDWNRSALFAGRLEIREITAEEILLPRLGVSDQGEAPTPEAQPFQLPDLPVSLSIGQITANRVQLGEPVLGVAAEVSLGGSLALGGGQGEAKLAIVRRDQPGEITLDAGFDNTTNILRIDLSMQEDEGGILATLAQLPGTPSVDFRISGDAPISDFSASLRLATSGQERLQGTIQTTKTVEARTLSAKIGGDITPVFAPQYRPFFGDALTLSLDSTLFDDGRIIVPQFAIKAREVTFTGALELDANRAPRRIDVQGEIATENGTQVVLPLAGEETRVNRADLSIRFDAAQSDDWNARFQLVNPERGDLSADTLSLAASGVISSGDETALAGTIKFSTAGFSDESGLSDALGQIIDGAADLTWQQRTASLERFELTGQDLQLTGAGAFKSGSLSGTAQLTADKVSNFSKLLGRRMTGRAELAVEGTYDVPLRAFSATAKGTTIDLGTSLPQLDALLAGRASLELAAIRSASGFKIDLFNLSSDHARLSGAADLRSGGSTVRVQGDLQDTSLVIPGFDGPSKITIAGTEDDTRDWSVAANLNAPSTELNFNGIVANLYDLPTVQGSLKGSSADISVFSSIAGRKLAGEIAFTAEGGTNAKLTRSIIDATATGQNLSIGSPDLDQLLRGRSDVALNASYIDQKLDVDTFDLKTAGVTAKASGSLADENDKLTFEARLANVAPFAAGLSGALTLDGTATRQADGFGIDLAAVGPGGARASVVGTISEAFDTANLSIDGNAPLSLANRFIAPRSIAGQSQFDLRMTGRPSLEALSGQVVIQNARLSSPDVRIALGDIDGSVTLGARQARLDLAAAVESGGRLTVSGPIALSSPFAADITANIDRATLTDPRLYETRANGQLRIIGPLAGGASISGQIDLEETNIQIPSSGLGGAGAIPEITHLREPPPVRGTRQKAGLLGPANGSASGGGPSYPLNLQINAPNRIFLRGRGLDSEFSGALRLTGTTADPVPIGGFELVRGRLDILGRRLALDEARITIQGGLTPYLNILASTQAEETQVNVSVIGPADNPEITFSSSPELPQEEVLARLIFGRGIDTLSPIQAARLALAVRTLSGSGGEGIVSKIRGQTGLADLDVTTDEDGNAAVRAGAYLGENVYSDVTVDSAGETQLNLNLDVSPSLTVRGGVTNEGETSLGIFFERDY